MSTSDRNLPSRTLVLCFDGTGSFFDATNTNVVKLFSFLKKEKKEEQLVYYQAGIGTYVAPTTPTGVELWAAKLLDEAFAWYLDAHIMGGYKFLMQNYRAGDRVCMFGFSRGGYTARALAGMLYKVGLLPRDNDEQVAFAYQLYQGSSKNNNILARSFKQTFSRTVKVEFIGCWDTVSSVGVFWSRHLPFTSSNTSIKCFRHALSLDEHRAKFQPNTWHGEAPDNSGASDDPEDGSYVPKNKDKTSDIEKGKTADEIGPPTDVLEVWFAGFHGDVGGGATPSDMQCTLSDISLRWMIREIVRSKCGVQFDSQALVRAGIPLSILSTETNITLRLPQAATEVSLANVDSGEFSSSKDGITANIPLSAMDPELAKKDALDAVQPAHDQLQITPSWWLLEIIPFFVSWQDGTGTWHRAFRWNLGRGRIIYAPNPKLHSTVQQRMETKDLAYVPKAQWNKANEIWIN